MTENPSGISVDQWKGKCISSGSGLTTAHLSWSSKAVPTFLMMHPKMGDALWLGQGHCPHPRVSDLESVTEQEDVFPGRSPPPKD